MIKSNYKIMINDKAKSFITIMMVIALTALLLRVAIDRIIKVTIVQNEANAAATLKLISAALENFAAGNAGAFPEDFSELLKTTPAYLDKDYTSPSSIKGYDYNCSRLEKTGYTCHAIPVNCGLTGRLAYTVTTGGLLISEDCKTRE